jgi:hypothetical protein
MFRGESPPSVWIVDRQCGKGGERKVEKALRGGGGGENARRGTDKK